MRCKEAEELFAKGLEALGNDHVYLARTCLEQARELNETPEIVSYLALCQAQTKGQLNEAILLANQALAAAPTDCRLYLNLAQIHLIAGEKERALGTLRAGIPHDQDSLLLQEVERHGKRRKPPFPALRRSHPLNKYLGILLSRLKLR